LTKFTEFTFKRSGLLPTDRAPCQKKKVLTVYLIISILLVLIK